MSLRVWLPLNGNLNNQGLSDITVSNVGATLDNNGKLGKCYYFGTSTSYLILSNDAMNECTTECSLSFWLNIKSWNTSYATYFQAGLGGPAWNNYIFGVLRNQTTSNLCFTISNGSTASNNSYITPDLELNTWYHLTFVYKTGHCLIYVNGALYRDYTTTIVPNFSGITKTTVGVCNNGSSYQTNCKLNDVRIYDHALSPKEIEILSRGLVCHYPLNNNGGGQPNLYDFESVANKWVVDGLTLANATDEVYGNVLKITSPSSVSSQRIYRTVSNVWKADTKFTVSFLAKASKTAVVKMSRSLANYAPDVTVGTTWKWYSTVITCSTTVEGGTLSIQTSTASADIYITQIKLELGDKATVYCPGVGDSHYIPLGYNSTTEYDVSGYGYNGTKTGTFAYLTDTPRYNVSTNIKGASSYIQIPNLTTTGFSNSYSFAWWGKVPSYQGYMMWGFFNGQRLNGIFNGNLWNTGDGASNPLYVPGTTTQVTVPTVNVWHHWVMTGDGTTCKVYQDGVLWGQAKTYKSISGTTIYLNGWNAGTSYTYSDYQMSDFRIYATALSAAQVAELYNTAVSVANNGTLMGYELVEV